MIWSRSE